MPVIQVEVTGVAAELVLGHYMPDDPTIYNDWQEFFHYNDLIHESQLLSNYISEIVIKKDGELIYQKKNAPFFDIEKQKSFSPIMEQNKLYLRTECVENALYKAEFEVKEFDVSKLTFETQDYDFLFKVSNSFVNNLLYNRKRVELVWVKGEPVGNICLLCNFDSGYLLPVYDAIKKESSEHITK